MGDPLIVILVRGVEPANIVMRVAHYVEVECIFIVLDSFGVS